jgi:N utilization substance protein B
MPVKVTINEYLELAKEYSTPKSSIFINGILDSLSKEYQNNQKLNKTGRGLM